MLNTPQTYINRKETNHIYFKHETNGVLFVVADEIGIDQIRRADTISFRWDNDNGNEQWTYVYDDFYEHQKGSCEIETKGSLKSIMVSYE